MFILDVSVGVSVRFYVGDWFSFTLLFFLLDIRSLCRLLCGRRVRVGGWRVGLAGAPQLHLICGSVSATGRAARCSPRPRRPAASLHADKAFLVVLETPRLKPLRFWALGCMHWLMWTVTCFRFLSWSELASPGARLGPAAHSRLYLPMCQSYVCARVTDQCLHTVRGVVPRRGMYRTVTMKPEKI